MSSNIKKHSARRRFLTGIGVVATGATLAASAQAASAGHDGTRFHPRRHDKDSWLEELGAGRGHRAFLDSSSGLGGATALNYANNILLGHREDYEGADSDYALIVCFRHQSTPLGYSDAMWEKYGGVFSRVTGLTALGSDEPLRVNPLNIERMGYANRGNTLAALRARGVQFAICSKATRSISGALAGATGGSAEDIYQELVKANIPQSRFVPAGVLAATRSQEYGYSLLYSG